MENLKIIIGLVLFFSLFSYYGKYNDYRKIEEFKNEQIKCLEKNIKQNIGIYDYCIKNSKDDFHFSMCIYDNLRYSELAIGYCQEKFNENYY